MLVDGETIAALLAPGHGRRRQPPTARSTPPASTSSPAASTCTPTWSCPSAAPFASDTFETGTRAAAWGGTTTIIDFAVQRTGEQRAGRRWPRGTRKADGNCAIDYGFHQIIGGVDDESLKAMDYLVDHEGVTSFKLFMAYPGRLLLRRRPDPAGDAEGRRATAR